MRANEKDSMVFYTLIPSGIWPEMAKAYLFMVSVNLAKTSKKVGQSHFACIILGIIPRLLKADDKDSMVFYSLISFGVWTVIA